MRVSGMHKRTNIQLSRAERNKLKAVVANRNSPQKHVWRAKIVLLTADGRGTAEIMQATGKAKTVIWRWQERFRDEGAAGLWRDKTRRSRIPPLSPEVARRVVALTLAGPPPAASHWSGSAMAKAAGVSVSCQFGAADMACSWPPTAPGASVQTVQRSAVCRQTARDRRPLSRSARPRHCPVCR